jgi:hypothetical protein
MNEGVPAEVRDFLREYVHNYEQLEVLILMQQHLAKDWTADSVGEKLQISPESAGEALHHLWTKLLLDCISGSPLRYRLGRADVGSTVQSIADLYRQNRLLLMGLMNANAIERVRTGAMRDFANAFVIGARKKSDG